MAPKPRLEPEEELSVAWGEMRIVMQDGDL